MPSIERSTSFDQLPSFPQVEGGKQGPAQASPPGQGDPAVGAQTGRMRAQAKQDPQAQSMLERAAKESRDITENVLLGGVVRLIAAYTILPLILLACYDLYKEHQDDQEVGKANGKTAGTGETGEGEEPSATDD